MEPRDAPRRRGPGTGIRTPEEGLAWLAGTVFALSSFMGWYTGDFDGLTVSVLGWHTGALGKLVFVLGLLVILLLALRATGFELPPALPVGMVILGLGAVGTIIVLIRLLSIPEDFTGFGRSIGIWISLVSAVAVAVAGLLRGADDL